MIQLTELFWIYIYSMNLFKEQMTEHHSEITARSLHLPGMQCITPWRRAKTVVSPVQNDCFNKSWHGIGRDRKRLCGQAIWECCKGLTRSCLYASCNHCNSLMGVNLIPCWRCSIWGNTWTILNLLNILNQCTSLTGVGDLIPYWRSPIFWSFNIWIKLGL